MNQDRIIQLLNEARELLDKQPDPDQFSAYPLYLTCRDIQDILQVSKSKARSIMLEPDFPLVRFGKSMRVHRDKFFAWVLRKEAETKGSMRQSIGA